ncbi:MAG: S8 family serine peptidase [Thermoanaerobaculia bacterium]
MIRKAVLIAAIVLAMPLLAETRQRYTIVTNPDAPRSASLRRLTSNAEEKIARRVRTYRNVSGFAADLTPAEAEELRKTAGVSAVEPVVERWAAALPKNIAANYERYDQQITPWGLPVVRVAEVWPVTRGEGINVAVLDTGIDWTHPDLQAASAGGVNILDETKPPMDDNLHGTHVAGIIAATDNGFGVVGAAPGVKIWNVKVLDVEGKGYDEYTAAGIDWVVEQQRLQGGRWVINMSLGSASLGGKLEGLAVARAFDAGVILVAAAGNRNQDWLDYPAAYPGVIGVGAIGEDGERAPFSSYGLDMPIVAPGVEVQSTFMLGTETIGELAVGEEIHTVRGLIGSPYGSITGKLIPSGHGAPGEFPASVAGNIALIQRGGDLAFREKARNAKEAGAAAVAIWNHENEPGARLWTLWPKGCGPGEDKCEPEWKDYQFPLTVSVSNADGAKLATQASGKTATLSYFQARYGRLSGTSMATPHVAAIAALLLVLDPTMNPTELEFVLRHTARDTSKPGWDYDTGYGIVDALAAAQFVAPQRFNVPPPNYTSPRRRSTRP